MTTSNTPIYASQARPWLKFYDQKYIDQTMPACTAFELVCRQNKNRLGETALEYYGRKFTYADFIVNVKKTAAALRAAGLKKGDIATVVSVMTPEIIFAFYAADMIGATLNLVDPRYSVEGIREYIEEVDSHLLICLNVVYERCHQAAKRTHVEHVVVLSRPIPCRCLWRWVTRSRISTRTSTIPTSSTGSSSLLPGRTRALPRSPMTRSTPVWWCIPAAPPAPPRA